MVLGVRHIIKLEIAEAAHVTAEDILKVKNAHLAMILAVPALVFKHTD
jgi:hypothetical protein